MWRCCKTNEPKHPYSIYAITYEITKERHSVRAASRFSLKVLRVESDLCGCCQTKEPKYQYSFSGQFVEMEFHGSYALTFSIYCLPFRGRSAS